MADGISQESPPEVRRPPMAAGLQDGTGFGEFKHSFARHELEDDGAGATRGAGRHVPTGALGCRAEAPSNILPEFVSIDRAVEGVVYLRIK